MEASNGSVVAGHPTAAAVGLDVLRRGGNAIDAGIAAGLAMTVVMGHECSFMGVAPTLVYYAASKEVITFDGVGTWPSALTLEMFATDRERRLPDDILHALPPGAPDAWLTALGRFGTMNFTEISAPSIHLAEHGFPMYDYLSNVLLESPEIGRRWTSLKKAVPFANDTTSPKQTWVQKDLAATLRDIVAAEARAMSGSREAGLRSAREFIYKGELADKVIQYCRSQGGLLSAADFAKFHGRCEHSVSVSYRGLEVYTTGAWGQGNVLLQALKILEGFDLNALGHNSVDYIHLLSQALNLAFADREQYIGDPLFIDVPLDEMLSEDYLRKRRSLIDMNHAWPRMPPAGDPRSCEAVLAGEPLSPRSASRGETTIGRSETGTAYVGAIDAAGNIFSCTASDGTRSCPIVPGTGMVLSQRGTQSKPSQGHPAAPAPGKRPRLTPSPVIVLKDGRPFMALGGYGGDKIPQACLQIFLNAVEFGFDPQAAINAPRFYSFNFPNSAHPSLYLPGVLKVEQRIDSETIRALSHRGHTTELLPAWWDGACLYGMIRKDPDGPVIRVGADPRGSTCGLTY